MRRLPPLSTLFPYTTLFRSGFRKFHSRDAHVTAALSSFAIGLIMLDLSHKVWGTEPLALPIPGSLQTASVEIFGTNILLDRKSTRLNSSHLGISYAVFCLKK